MTNCISDGTTITVTAGGTITAGSPVLIGSVLVLPVTSAASGEDYAAYLTGVFSVPKAAEAISQGDALYWDAGNSVVTKTPGTDSKPLIGFAWSAALLGAATVDLRLVPTMQTGPSS